MKKIHLILFFYALLYVSLYFTTLNLNYVEGDDAATVLYHLCGKNWDIQRPYAGYNSGFDFLLAATNLQTEVSLRSFSVIISFIFGFIVLSLCAIFLEMLLRNHKGNQKYYFMALLPFMIPDFIFHSLVVNANAISFAFAFSGALIYMLFLQNNKWVYYIVSILLLALAIPFRWSIVSMFPFYFSVMLLYSNKTLLQRFVLTACHNACALLIGLGFIFFTGYDFGRIQYELHRVMSYLGDSDKSALSLFASGSAFFTASFVLALCFGIYAVIRFKKQNRLQNVAFVFLPLIPFMILGFYPLFKFLMPLLPILLLIGYFGYLFISKYKYVHYAFLASVALSWFVGIKIYADGTFSGPGFELSTTGKTNTNTSINEKNTDSRIKLNKITPSFSGGFYLPMPEGPRPLYGYFYAIFGGEWKKNIDNFTNDRTKIISILEKKQGHLYFQDGKNFYLLCDLYKNGYHTKTDFKKYDENFVYRDFLKNNDTIRIFAIDDHKPKSEVAKSFIENNPKVVFRSSYSSLILSISQQNQDVKLLGPFALEKTK